MSIKIDGKVYVTTAEACKLLNVKHAYLFECIYRTNFVGIISIDDPESMIEHLKSINVDPARKENNPRYETV